MASRDTNFYYSFVVLPAVKRRAIIAVWDFCRAVDDAVDEAAGPSAALGAGTCSEADQAARELARWRQELAICYEGGRPETRQGQSLVPYIVQFGLPRQAFEDLIDGVAMDVHPRRYATFDALYQYCRRVASAVGLVCVEIFGYQDRQSREYAVELGVALQLTNIIRDLSPDVARGRLYVPLEDLVRFDCCEAELQAGVSTPKTQALLRYQCQRARAFYERAARALPPGDARRLVAARIMGAIYFAILEDIERSQYDVFSRVARIPRPRRAIIAARTWMATMLGF